MRLDWYIDISDRVADYLSTLEKDSVGRYLPCRTGTTRVGCEMELGWSCFALRILWTLGYWEKISSDHKCEWLNYIQSFQNLEDVDQHQGITINAYVDSALVRHVQRPTYKNIFEYIKSSRKTGLGLRNYNHPRLESIVAAESKQAIATLSEVDTISIRPYRNIPLDNEQLSKYVFSLDWRFPWSAGGQAATLAVFLSLEAPRFLNENIVRQLKAELQSCYRQLVVAETGGYYTGKTPDHGMLVNGAMKVLTALDWLDEPIHYPENLIDTTLSQSIRSDGCHLVDAVYVLHRCTLQTDYRRNDINKCFVEVLDLISRHYNVDGGFSYDIGCAQRFYYGVPISRGLNESDIHGTLLLTWALAMIRDVLATGKGDWQIIRP